MVRQSNFEIGCSLLIHSLSQNHNIRPGSVRADDQRSVNRENRSPESDGGQECVRLHRSALVASEY